MLLLLLAACDGDVRQPAGPRYSDVSPGDAKPVYRIAVHLGYTPGRVSVAYQPLIDYLNHALPDARFELETARDFSTYESRFRARAPEFLFPNPWQTLEAMKSGYHVIAMAGDADDFKGVFIVRNDSAIRNVADLKNKVVSYPSPTALAACIMPQYFLHSSGLDVNADIDNRYVGSQESSIMHAYLGQADAAATWPPSWRLFQKNHAREAAELRVAWETPALMNNAVMARDDVPAAVQASLRQALLDLARDGNGGNGGKILAGMETARFYAANDAAYEPVREFIQRFEREVRPVEQ